MKLPQSTIFFINVTVILAGIILAFIGAYLGQGIWSTLFVAIGTSAIATGGVSLFDRFLTEKPKIDEIKMIA